MEKFWDATVTLSCGVINSRIIILMDDIYNKFRLINKYTCYNMNELITLCNCVTVVLKSYSVNMDLHDTPIVFFNWAFPIVKV